MRFSSVVTEAPKRTSWGQQCNTSDLWMRQIMFGKADRMAKNTPNFSREKPVDLLHPA